jgi:hypothetical protein
MERNGYDASMNRDVEKEREAEAVRPDKLALAQQAFRDFHSRCFWFMREDAQITAEDVPYICQRLRADGGREGFFLAAQICQ